MCGIYTVGKFGRRTILLFGHSMIAVLLFLIALATIKGWDSIQMGLVCLFIFAF